MYDQNGNPYEPNNGNKQTPPGKSKATAAFVLSLIAAGCLFTGYGSFVTFVLSVIAFVFANQAKKEGCNDSMRTAAYIISLVCMILSSFVAVACIACVGCSGCSALCAYPSSFFSYLH